MKKKLEPATKYIFFQFLNNEITVLEFEHWVYKNSGFLEKELQADSHLDLISFNYKHKDSFHLIKDILLPYIDNLEFNIWRTKRLLLNIIENKIDLVVATRKLHTLYFETNENFIPITLGIGYASELSDVPTPTEYEQWDKSKLEEKLKIVEWYKDHIIRDSKEFLATLEKEEDQLGHNKS